MPPSGTKKQVAQARTVTIDHTSSLTVNIVTHSIHVVAYRLWQRPNASAPWSRTGEGTTEDSVTDSHDLGVVGVGSSMVYWLGLAGPAKSRYSVQIIYVQSGKVVNGGVLTEDGACDGKGVAAVQRKVVFP